MSQAFESRFKKSQSLNPLSMTQRYIANASDFERYGFGSVPQTLIFIGVAKLSDVVFLILIKGWGLM